MPTYWHASILPAPNTPQQPAERPLWPFPPRLLDYSHPAPAERPVRDPVRPPADVPDALF